jgi:DNA-binding LacI/PurR family transcriptional regulator
MTAAGLDPTAHRGTQFTIAGGYATGLAVLADPRHRPTAIVAGSDEVAIGVIVAARQLGIPVPGQLSVTGIDGHELAAMFDLTTLAQDPGAQGSLAVELVMNELLGTGPALSRDWRPYPVVLQVRGSTTAPPSRTMAAAR